MPEVTASVAVPGPEEAVLDLWFDTRRWPSFVDGLKAVVRAAPEWPAGGVVEWESTPHGPGRTRETARGGGTVDVEDPRMRGTREVRYADGALHVTLRYELKGSRLAGLFIRRALRDSLERTLTRFAAERRSDLELT